MHAMPGGTLNTPDRWTVIRVIDGSNKQSFYKIYCGNYGGYGGGDSWKLSGEIKSAVDSGVDWYEIKTMSGSVYILHKNSEGMSGYMTRKFQSMTEGIAELGDGSSFEVTTTAELLTAFK